MAAERASPATRAPVGISHLTVVPSNFEPEPGDGEETDPE
jgi:hypothetical protein